MKFLYVNLILACLTQIVASEEDCTIIAVAGVKTDLEDSNDIDFLCELDAKDNNGISGFTVPMKLNMSQKEDMKTKLSKGEVKSGSSKLSNSLGATISQKGVKIPVGTPVKVLNNDVGSSSVSHFGKKYFLGVRVKAADKTHSHTAQVMSDNIFGSYGDPNNMKSQMFDCSWGQYEIIPGVNPSSNQDISEHEEAPGIIEVNIGLNLVGNDRYTIKNAVTAAVQELLGFTLPGPFDHVMYMLEGCYTDCGWAGYAYINSWNQVYQGIYYSFTGVQVHELGHNLGMAHSGGLDGATYTDHTCMMGNPLYSDDVGKMCFNPAKNWYLGWYGDDYVTFDPSTEGCWTGTIIGIGEWDSGNYGIPVDIKIETGTSEDYFIGFNRAAGPNAQNDEADDEVTIVQTGNNGISYSQSSLKSHLTEGESYTFSNWKGSGEDLSVIVNAIDITSTPGTAQVTIQLGSFPCQGYPTPAPTTPSPTPSTGPCTKEVTVSVTTDSYPSETSWSITSVDDPNNDLMSGSNYADQGATYSETEYLTCGKTYKFTINDTYGDGNCCSYGEGNFIVTVEGSVVAEGGEFGSTEVKEFVIQEDSSPTNPPNPSPTNPPSPSPANPPSSSPINPPSSSPTNPPTPSPSNPPSSSPINPPTPSPTNPPSSSPTNPPTPSPTNPPTPSPTNPPSSSPTNHPSSSPINPPSSSPTNPPIHSPTIATNPPVVPTSSPVTSPNFCEIFTLSLTTDMYGYETSFALVNELAGKLRLMGGAYTSSKTFEESACLANGRYIFTISDSHGDGICCGSQGDGSYKITLGDELIGQGGDFGESEQIVFDVGPPGPTRAPTSAPSCLFSGLSCLVGDQCCSERCKNNSCV